MRLVRIYIRRMNNVPTTQAMPAPAAMPVAPHHLSALVAGEALTPIWRSDELLAGGREARIEHHGAVYRLRMTSLGKLILTK
jgi:hemin uptake protein HemP